MYRFSVVLPPAKVESYSIAGGYDKLYISGIDVSSNQYDYRVYINGYDYGNVIFDVVHYIGEDIRTLRLHNLSSDYLNLRVTMLRFDQNVGSVR